MRKVNYWFVFLIICLATFVLWHGNYQPYGDSRDYLKNYLYPLVDGKSSLEQILVSHNHHILIGYFGWFIFPLVMWGKNIFVVHIINLLIGIAGLCGFYLSAKTIFKTNPFSLTLLIAIMAFNPLFLTNLINPNPDFGVVCFLMLTIGFILKEKLYWAAVSGLFLVLSKEIGVALYLVLILTYPICYRKHFDWNKYSRNYAIFKALLLSLPIFIIILIKSTVQVPGFIAGYMKDDSDFYAIILKYGLNFDIHNILSVAAAIFLPHFFWIPALTLIITAGLIIINRLCSSTKWIFNQSRDSANIIYLSLIFIASFFFVSRIVPFLNPRYFLSIYPLFFLLFYASLKYLSNNIRIINFILLIYLILLIYVDYQRDLRHENRYKIVTEENSIIIRVVN